MPKELELFQENCAWVMRGSTPKNLNIPLYT